MKIIDVKNIDEAVMTLKDILAETFKTKSIKNIAFTGGRFGESILSSFVCEYIGQNTQIFQTDERFVKYDDDQCIQKMIKNGMVFSGAGSNKDRFNFFRLDVSANHSVELMSDLLNKKNIDAFDLVFLSLGEDGHLAGDFGDSDQSVDNRICITSNAIKPPKERISYTASWLLSSENIFLAAVGREKEKAYHDFINDEGLHSSKINYEKNIIVFKDKNFK